MSDYLDPNNEELLKDFYNEAEAQVEALEQNILVLETDPGSADAIDEIFRAAHTLKGAAATVQMNELAGFTHILEDVLDDIRSEKIKVTESVVDILLNSIDIIKAMLEERSEGAVYSGDTSSLEKRLKSLQGKELPAAPKKTEPVVEKKKPVQSKVKSSDASKSLSEYELLELKDASQDGETVYDVTVSFDENNPMNTVGGIQVFAVLKSAGTILKTVPDFDELYSDQFFKEVNYYIATAGTKEEISEKLIIPDVILSTEVHTLDEIMTGESDDAQEFTLQEPLVTDLANDDSQNALQEADADPADEAVKEAISRVHNKTQVKDRDKKTKASSVLRVDSRRIDNLLNLVSEAVINKATFNQIVSQFSDNQMQLHELQTVYRDKLRELFDALPEYLEAIQDGSSIKDIKKNMQERFGSLYTLIDSFESGYKGIVGEFKSTAQNLGRITSDLQEGVMQIRMVPISQIFSRFPRLVRDVSKSLNKRINLVIEGEDTELDKSVIEDLLDPLIHCVRNSVDHGIESADERESKGKEPEGTINLKASNEGNMIIIEIRDDGKGIDVESVRQRAIERGVIHPNKALTDIEAFNLIFEPGFSTAKRVTDISGRGVGLDVVRRQIEKLNGSVSVWAEKNTGTKFTIKIPLTLAIIQGLLVRVGSEIYAIPITSVLDSHRIKPDEIRMIDNYEVFNVRDDVVSLIRLNRLFRIPTNETKEYHFVVVVGSGDKKMGLVVDSLIGEEDVVIKPLRDKYTNSPGIAGATILGDGTVSLIIDVSQLLELGLRKEMEIRRNRELKIK